jgi:hypothetical protein
VKDGIAVADEVAVSSREDPVADRKTSDSSRITQNSEKQPL